MKIVKVSEIKSNPINEQIYDLSGIEELAASIDEVGHKLNNLHSKIRRIHIKKTIPITH